MSTHKHTPQTRTAPRRRGPGGPPPMMGGEKVEDFGAIVRRLIQYCRQFIPLLVLALVLASAGAILNVIGPQYLAQITDLISEGIVSPDVAIDVEAAVFLAGILTLLYCLGFVFNMGQGLITARVSQRIAQRMRGDISRKINKLPLRYFDRSSMGDVLSRVTNDVDTVGQSLNQSLSSLVSAVATLVGTLIMMFATNVIMTVAGVLSALIGFAAMMLIVKHSQKYFVRQQRSLGAVNGHVEEIFSGHTVVKAYNGEHQARATFDRLNDDLYESAWKSQFFSGLNGPLMMFIGNFGFVVVCVVGVMLVFTGQTSFGVVVAFMLYIRLFTQPLSQIAQTATSLQSAAAASERFFEFLDEEEQSDEHDKPHLLDSHTVKGDVTFDHVKFGYSDDALVIRDFSAEIHAGQKVAIVGPTGAGKTTLVNLLMRFYDPVSGEIRIDGVPTSSVPREEIRELFAMVLQDTWLFEGTVHENIAYGTEGATREQVIQACKATGLHHYVCSLAQGYDTVLGDDASLSMGQRQLVTIARAMLKNAPMLVLDEATSSVDTRTEVLIQRAMDALMVGRTSFVIAHRLSTIRNADLILVIRDGDIVESGTHEELLALGGFYADLNASL